MKTERFKKYNKTFVMVILFAMLSVVSFFIVLANAQTIKKESQEKKMPYSIQPTYSNVSYGSHERNVFDIWLTDSKKRTPLALFIHGGGYKAGDKKHVPVTFLQGCLDAGISVAALNYRFHTDSPFPAPMHDCAQALQFIRAKAHEWNIDPKQISSSGSSAGGCISLWLALHDDMADKVSGDEIKRFSTRLAAVSVYNAQTSQDPEYRLKYIYNGIVSDETNLYRFIGKPEGEPFDGDYKKLAKEASPIIHISEDDTIPFRLYYLDNKEPIVKGMSRGKMVHNSAYGFILQRKMLDMGLNNCQVIVNITMDDYCKETVDFLKEVFFK